MTVPGHDPADLVSQRHSEHDLSIAMDSEHDLSHSVSAAAPSITTSLSSFPLLSQPHVSSSASHSSSFLSACEADTPSSPTTCVPVLSPTPPRHPFPRRRLATHDDPSAATSDDNDDDNNDGARNPPDQYTSVPRLVRDRESHASRFYPCLISRIVNRTVARRRWKRCGPTPSDRRVAS